MAICNINEVLFSTLPASMTCTYSVIPDGKFLFVTQIRELPKLSKFLSDGIRRII